MSGTHIADAARSSSAQPHLHAGGPQVGGLPKLELPYALPLIRSTCGWSAGKWVGWAEIGVNLALNPTYVRVVRT
jgi:hypothetical protein